MCSENTTDTFFMLDKMFKTEYHVFSFSKTVAGIDFVMCINISG